MLNDKMQNRAIQEFTLKRLCYDFDVKTQKQDRFDLKFMKSHLWS